jgi:propionate CoA-transferase
VEQLSFSAAHALETGRQVLYVTERAVFALQKEGLALVEVAPGIDLASQVLDLMEFEPIMEELKPMPDKAFS